MHTQSVSALLPGAEAVLAGHAEQLPVPVAALYVPASHAKHSTPFDVAVYPATHVQSVSESLPAAEPLLAGHAEQTPAPVAALYVPAPHATHATPFDDAVYPATHEQSPAAVLPAAELVCAGHAVQMPVLPV